jgi:hypothetical protein
MEDIIKKFLSVIGNGMCKYDKHTYIWEPNMVTETLEGVGEVTSDLGCYKVTDHDDIDKARSSLSKFPALEDAVKALTGVSEIKSLLNLQSLDGVLQSFKYNDERHTPDSDLIAAFDELLIEIES